MGTFNRAIFVRQSSHLCQSYPFLPLLRKMGMNRGTMKVSRWQLTIKFRTKAQSKIGISISAAAPGSRIFFSECRRAEGGCKLRVRLPAPIAAAGHRLECDTNMRLAIGFASLNRQATEPKIFGSRIANWPFTSFLGQFHQAYSLR